MKELRRRYLPPALVPSAPRSFPYGRLSQRELKEYHQVRSRTPVEFRGRDFDRIRMIPASPEYLFKAPA